MDFSVALGRPAQRGVIPSMQKGDVFGHETMGDGAENNALKVGDRVVVPFTISCGQRFFCKKDWRNLVQV
jgi:threonine dehydrogenase-like Zn-dependent dehydrogenase